MSTRGPVVTNVGEVGVVPKTVSSTYWGALTTCHAPVGIYDVSYLYL
jgi:hypothetical protein